MEEGQSVCLGTNLSPLTSRWLPVTVISSIASVTFFSFDSLERFDPTF